MRDNLPPVVDHDVFDWRGWVAATIVGLVAGLTLFFLGLWLLLEAGFPWF